MKRRREADTWDELDSLQNRSELFEKYINSNKQKDTSESTKPAESILGEDPIYLSSVNREKHKENKTAFPEYEFDDSCFFNDSRDPVPIEQEKTEKKSFESETEWGKSAQLPVRSEITDRRIGKKVKPQKYLHMPESEYSEMRKRGKSNDKEISLVFKELENEHEDAALSKHVVAFVTDNDASQESDKLNRSKNKYKKREKLSLSQIVVLISLLVCVVLAVLLVVLHSTSGTGVHTDSIPEDSNVFSVNSYAENDITESAPDSEVKDIKIKKPETLDSDIDFTIPTEESPLSYKFIPKNLVRLSNVPYYSGIRVTFATNEAFKKMHSDMKDDGVADGLKVLRGYVSYSNQKSRYKAKYNELRKETMTKESADVMADYLVGKHGLSEHQLGTAIDLTTDGTLQSNFLNLEAGAWIKENAQNYGFIIRYSMDKSDIHKKMEEPWHLRYVGVEAAQYMYAENLCLEEYVELFNDGQSDG